MNPRYGKNRGFKVDGVEGDRILSRAGFSPRWRRFSDKKMGKLFVAEQFNFYNDFRYLSFKRQNFNLQRFLAFYF